MAKVCPDSLRIHIQSISYDFTFFEFCLLVILHQSSPSSYVYVKLIWSRNMVPWGNIIFLDIVVQNVSQCDVTIKYEAFDNTAIKLLIFPSISFNRILWESHLSMINVKKVFTHNLWVAACFYIYKTCKLAILYRCTWWWINEHHMYRYILNMTQIHCNVRPKDSKYNLIWQKTNYISLKVTLAMYFLHLWNICKKDPNVFGIVIFYINK